MPEAFDAYHKWLGIPPKDQPPSHYRILGIDPFEEDPEVIQAAAERQMAHVRKHHLGPHSQASQKILNEISAAKLCLLKPEQKVAYDAELRRGLPAHSIPPPIPTRGDAQDPHSGPRPWIALCTRWAGRVLVGLGLVLVLVARSCSSLGDLAVARARAKAELFQAQLEEELEDRADPSRLSGPIKQLLDKATSGARGSTEIEGKIEQAEDQDTFEFDAPASGTMQIDLTATDGALDGNLRVYDRNRQLLEENDNDGGGRNARVTVDVLIGQTYFIEVAASGTVSSSASAATGGYRLAAKMQESDDDFEDNFDVAHELEFRRAGTGTDALDHWRDLDSAARQALHMKEIRAYWCQWLFLLGSIFLVFGLLQMAFLGQGAERWICLAMVAMILFSLYVGGVGWVGDMSGVRP